MTVSKNWEERKSEGFTYVLACTSSGAACAVQKVLLQSVAPSSKLWARAAEHAVAVVTCIRIVALGITSHDRLALHVSARALTRSTRETVAAVRAILLSLVFGAVRGVAGTCFLRITYADRTAANCGG